MDRSGLSGTVFPVFSARCRPWTGLVCLVQCFLFSPPGVSSGPVWFGRRGQGVHLPAEGGSEGQVCPEDAAARSPAEDRLPQRVREREGGREEGERERGRRGKNIKRKIVFQVG